LKGCGPLSAAKIVAETAGVERLRTDAKFARLAGVPPPPRASGSATGSIAAAIVS
jgi:transposase